MNHRTLFVSLGVVFLLSAFLAAIPLAQEKTQVPKFPAEGAPPAAREPPAQEEKAGYVGSETCKSCHPEAYRVWLGSNHGRSFVILQTAAARQVSEEPNAYAGIPSPKMMAECTPCHAPGLEIPKKERGGLHPEDGVQCETCHGPGGHYADEETMKDPVRRVQAGLNKLTPEGCLRCHKEKPSHVVLGRPPFDFEKYWAKFDHRKDRQKVEKKERY
ncbi:MAG: multiheme c-type cytochrome [Planctomycetota bacterium]